MAAQFKNIVTELDTTGSGQTILRCPAGKTILIKGFRVRNTNASNSISYLAFEDNSISTSSFPLQKGTVNAGTETTSQLPFVLEQNDELLWQTQRADQHITLSYLELDSGIQQRYKMITKSLTTADSADSFVTCPTGSTIIVNLVVFYNSSGSSATTNTFTITDSSASITKELDKGTIADAAQSSYNRAFVLESGDSLNFTPDEQPFTVYCTYLEMRNPPTRS